MTYRNLTGTLGSTWKPLRQHDIFFISGILSLARVANNYPARNDAGILVRCR